MLFKKLKALPIVRWAIQESKDMVENGRKENIIPNILPSYYERAECYEIALCMLFSDIYSKSDKLGNAILKEALTGTWHQFGDSLDKQIYKQTIIEVKNSYVEILQKIYADEDIPEQNKLDAAYTKISRVLVGQFGANKTEEAVSYFTDSIFDTREYILMYFKS